MKPSNTLLFVAMIVSLFGLSGCGNPSGGGGGSEPGPQGSKGPGSPVKPQFVIDTGLMDVWGKKKTGPREMAITPDGKLLLFIAQSKNNQVQVWDLVKRQKLHAFTNDIGTMNMPVAISPDGRTGAYVHLRPDQKIVLIDLVSGKETRVIKDKKRRLNSSATSMRFSPRGDLLVVIGGDEIIGWDPVTGKERFTWQNGARLNVLSTFFDDGKKIASLDESAAIKIWDVTTGKPVQTLSDGNSKFGFNLAVSGDGKTLITRGMQPFKFWDLPAGTVRKEVTEVQGTYPNILVLPDNRTVIWNTHDGMVVYDLATGARKQEVKGAHEGHLHSMAAKADGSMLITAGDDALIKGWSLNASGQIE
jgi:WD40 repeat protein